MDLCPNPELPTNQPSPLRTQNNKSVKEKNAYKCDSLSLKLSKKSSQLASCWFTQNRGLTLDVSISCHCNMKQQDYFSWKTLNTIH